MVQYVFTPWRDRRELLAVRQQFYPAADGETRSSSSLDVLEAQHAAVARVAVWMQRGHCPHMVESTALLMAAVLADVPVQTVLGKGGGAAPAAAPAAALAYAARATYAAAFSRFVTGLLDGHQDRARKLSMHGLAQTVGLPPGFVELRHQATHEALPGLRRLRVAARQALAWIWGYYWVNISSEDAEAIATAADAGNGKNGEVEDRRDDSKDDASSLRVALLEYVDNDDDDDDTAIPASFIEKWGEARVLAALAAISTEEEEDDEEDEEDVENDKEDDDGRHSRHGRALRCIRLSRKLLHQDKPTMASTRTTKTRSKTKATAMSEAAVNGTAGTVPWTMDTLDLDAVRATLAHDRQALYEMEGEGEEEEKEEEEGAGIDRGEDGDVVMEEHPGQGLGAAPEPELAARRPRWTRYSGAWTPRPIGVV